MKNSKRTITSNLKNKLSKRKWVRRHFGVVWEQYTPVKISEITDKGFWVKFLDRRIYFNRRRFPYFNDATEVELRDVALLYKDVLRWVSLDLDIELELINNQIEYLMFTPFVRGVRREDLFEDYWDGEHWSYNPKEDRKGGEL